jgi:hypothetical protein
MIVYILLQLNGFTFPLPVSHVVTSILSGYAVFFSIVLEYATRMIGVDVDYSSGN